MNIFSPNNPGISGLDELTDFEQISIQQLIGLNWANGDLLYYHNGFQRLPIGLDGQSIQISNGLPTWIDQSANTTISINSTSKTITITGANTLDNLYDYVKYWLTQNMSVANFMSASGKTVNITDYQIIGLQHLTIGTKLTSIQATGNFTSTGAFSIEVLGKVKQDIPTDLPATADFTELEYNTNTTISVVYAGTNKPTGKVTNIGTAIVNIQGGALTDYTDAEINYLDSDITFAGVDSITFYPTSGDANAGTNAGDTITTSPYNFKYGSVINGVTMSGTLNIRYVIAGKVTIGTLTIVLGTNTFILTDNELLGSIKSGLDTNLPKINRNVIKASKIIPASETF